MKKLLRIIITGFFFILPIVLLNFVSEFNIIMRWKTGSPLVPGYNWMRWSHLYLVLGSLFCIAMYVPIIISVIRKRLKILFIPFIAAIFLVIFSFAFVVISKNVYYRQIIKRCEQEMRNPTGALPYVLRDRGVAYGYNRENDKAIQDFTRAIEINPDNKGFIAECYNNRAVAYFYNGQFDKSWQDVSKAIEMGYRVNPEFLAALEKQGYKK